MASLAVKAIGGAALGWLGGRAIVLVTNRLGLAQGLHPIFVATAAVVVFAFGEAIHASGFLAVYLAGLVVGNQPTRAHSTIITFLDAITWLVQIVMFMLLGLLVWPERLLQNALPALGVARGVDADRGPAAVILCLSPFRFSFREKLSSPGGIAWRCRHLSGVDPVAGAAAECADLFRHRLCRCSRVAAGAGLDHCVRRASSACGACRKAIPIPTASNWTCSDSLRRNSSARRPERPTPVSAPPADPVKGPA